MLSTEGSIDETQVKAARPKVLIVEDEALIALEMCAKIESLGYFLIGVTDSGRKAIEIAKQNRPDVVLMDVHINADLNGIETAVCLQGIYDQPIPILFVTAYAVEDFPVIKAVHPYVVLRKPFSDEDRASSLIRVWADSNAF
jgi:CheY-like chemotaxis protein